jgi:hypothetical protein
MIHKTPTISDALIVVSMFAFVGFIGFLNKTQVEKTVTEVDKLEEQLKLERLKLNIEQIKENSLREKAMRDSRMASMGHQAGKKIQF